MRVIVAMLMLSILWLLPQLGAAAKLHGGTKLNAHGNSVVEAEQRRLANERRALDQQRRFETEQQRLNNARAQRDQQARLAAQRARTGRLSEREYALATAPRIGTDSAQDRFLRFFNFVRPALERDDYDAVKFAAEEMQVLGDREFTRDYYDKLRSLLSSTD